MSKGHSKTGFSVNDWKSSKTVGKMKQISRRTLILGWGKHFSKWEKLVSRSAQSQSWLCPFKARFPYRCHHGPQPQLTRHFFPDKNLRALSDWLRLTKESSRVQPCFCGRSAGSFPEQRLVIGLVPHSPNANHLKMPFWQMEAQDFYSEFWDGVFKCNIKNILIQRNSIFGNWFK